MSEREFFSFAPGDVSGPVAGVVSKAGLTSFGMVRRLAAKGLPAQVTDATKVLASVGPQTKCDRLLNHRLVRLASQGMRSHP